jgi:hypothetical protein
MECTVCGGRLDRCESCHGACDTALCSRCRDAVPEAHRSLVPAALGPRPTRVVYLDD